MDRAVESADEPIGEPVVDAGFDPAIADRAHDVLGGRLLDVDRGVSPTDLDGVVGVTAPGHREVVVGGEAFDPLAGAGMLAVDLDGVEVGVDLADGRVPVGVGDDRSTAPVVGQLNGLARGEFARFALGGRVGPHHEHVAATGRDLDTGDHRHAGDLVLEPSAVVVVGRRDAVEPTSARGPRQQTNPDRVVGVADAATAVEEAGVGVEVDPVHVGEASRQAFAVPLRTRVMTPHVRPNAVRTDGGGSRVLVYNPVSGNGSHTDEVYDLAEEYDVTVRETNEGGDAVDLARETDADLVAAGGGDGTLHEVVRGLYEADTLDTTTVAVIPTGTGNNFAGNVGIETIADGFETLDGGERRAIDLGVANGHPFVNSAIAGLTADASSETSADQKDSLGVLAYVVNTIRTAADFEGLDLSIETPDDEAAWTGKAAFVLVGNGRRFPVEGRTQANMEDGRFEVTVIEDRPTGKLVGEATLRRLLGSDTGNITRLEAPELAVSVNGGEPGTFSLDGEMLSARELDLETHANAVTLCVGEAYDPTPPAVD